MKHVLKVSITISNMTNIMMIVITVITHNIVIGMIDFVVNMFIVAVSLSML